LQKNPISFKIEQMEVIMELGTFSLSLAVKDIEASRTFYEAFGFEVIDGSHVNQDYPMEEGQAWMVLKLGTTAIGLFQGMFEENILTFNPPDVRGVQQHLKGKGITFEKEADEATTGPAHAMLTDPDGNLILLDQFE
jgi:catechol 2,3-dioxygenase-like lactoylglutathione lyase family enzyme